MLNFQLVVEREIVIKNQGIIVSLVGKYMYENQYCPGLANY